MTAPHPDHDPFILPLPAADTPVILAEYRVSDRNPRLETTYSAMIWHTAPMSANPSAKRSCINWHRCPEAFLSELKLATWTMINGELRPTFLRQRRGMRSRVSAGTVTHTVRQWVNLAIWLNGKGIRTLGGCSTAVLSDYSQHLAAQYPTRGTVQTALSALTRLWGFDQLTARPAGIGRPPWDELGFDNYLPALADSGGENRPEPVSEQVMAPLLVWALRMVDELSGDILRAWSHAQDLVAAGKANRATAEGKAALLAYMAPLIRNQAPLPVTYHADRPRFAREYVQGLTGAASSQLNTLLMKEGLIAAMAQRPGRCPISTPVTGTIAGSPWRDTLDLDEIDLLMIHLATACFIVIAYLTGMRPGEVLGLRSGCCPDPGPDSTTRRHLIHGKTFKTAKDQHGNHDSAGVERDVPWVAITPVVNAIRVMERIVTPGSLLFRSGAHNPFSRPKRTGSLKLDTMRGRIEAFINWANTEAATRNLHAEAIPADPHGPIGTGRFRRSLAWHIARRPGGLVALAIQYGHMRTALAGVAEGYASRSRNGIHDLIDIETARAVADTVARLHDQLEHGGGISGPAARRAINAAAKAPRFAGTIITAVTAKRLIANEDAMIYDNPQAFVLCHYKRASALCHRDGIKDTPSLDQCVPGCGNIIRTDKHAIGLRARADFLDQRAMFTPGPICDRLRANASRLRDLACTHDHTRITVKDAG